MNLDNKIMTFLSSLGDMFLLNIIYLICCIPIVTIGAATTALYYNTLKMAENRESPHIWKDFLRAFKENFRQATIIWLIILAIIFVLLFNGVLVGALTPALAAVVSLASIVAAIFLTLMVVYVFPMVARFDNTVGNLMKVSVLMAIRHLPSTIIVLLLHGLPMLLLLISMEAFVQGILVVLLFTVSIIAYWESKVFSRIFINYYPSV